MAEESVYKSNHPRMRVKMEGKEVDIPYPIAFHHLSLMEYLPSLDLETILLFEKMVVFFRSNKLKPFEYQQERLAEQLHIKRNGLDNARAALKKLKILIEENPGRGKKIRYSLDKEMIIANLPDLYKMPKDKAAKAKAIKELSAFYNYYLSKKYLREKVNESVPDNVHMGLFSITSADKRTDTQDDKKDDENNIYKEGEE